MKRLTGLLSICLALLPALLCGPLAGCDGKAICEKAAKKYVGCVEKKLGKEMADMARSKQKEGIKACKEDKKTQKMYKKCLPEKDCDKFMQCLMDYAKKEGP